MAAWWRSYRVTKWYSYSTPVGSYQNALFDRPCRTPVEHARRIVFHFGLFKCQTVLVRLQATAVGRDRERLLTAGHVRPEHWVVKEQYTSDYRHFKSVFKIDRESFDRDTIGKASLQMTKNSKST
jgi:hypothetical protein